MHLPALSHTERKRAYALFVRMHLPAPMHVRIFADSAGNDKKHRVSMDTRAHGHTNSWTRAT
jgi:hypothetical protein